MARRLTLIALLAFALAVGLQAAVAAKPVKPNGVTAAGSFFYARTLVQVGAGGLTPGDQYWCDVYFQASDDDYPYGYGQAQTVDDTGYLNCVFTLDFISHHEEGMLTAWVSEDYLDPPIMTANGEATTTLSVP